MRGQQDGWLLACLAPHKRDLEPTPQGLGLHIPTVGPQPALPPHPRLGGKAWEVKARELPQNLAAQGEDEV